MPGKEKLVKTAGSFSAVPGQTHFKREKKLRQREKKKKRKCTLTPETYVIKKQHKYAHTTRGNPGHTHTHTIPTVFTWSASSPFEFQFMNTVKMNYETVLGKFPKGTVITSMTVITDARETAIRHFIGNQCLILDIFS